MGILRLALEWLVVCELYHQPHKSLLKQSRAYQSLATFQPSNEVTDPSGVGFPSTKRDLCSS